MVVQAHTENLRHAEALTWNYAVSDKDCAPVAVLLWACGISGAAMLHPNWTMDKRSALIMLEQWMRVPPEITCQLTEHAVILFQLGRQFGERAEAQSYLVHLCEDMRNRHVHRQTCAIDMCNRHVQ